VRIEIGPKDLEKKQVVLARRDTSAKSPLPLAECTAEAMTALMEEIHETLYTQAKAFLDTHTYTVTTMDELKAKLEGEGGFVWAPWDDTVETAEKIKKETKATIRLLGEEVKGKKDILSGKPATVMALYAKAY
jgi:prolyl-tRNA synthetase